MSEFIDAVEVTLRGEKVFVPDTIRKHLSCYMQEAPPREEHIASGLQQVEFGMTWRSRKYCKKEEIDLIKQIFMDDLAHVIYGEFIHKLRDLRESIVDRRDEDSLRLIAEIMDECKGVR